MILQSSAVAALLERLRWRRSVLLSEPVRVGYVIVELHLRFRSVQRSSNAKNGAQTQENFCRAQEILSSARSGGRDVCGVRARVLV